jgi:Tfp pilus assembly protein PilN
MRAVNLIPSEQRGGAAIGAGRSEGGAYAVLAVLAGLAIFALAYGKAHRQVSSSRGQVASLTARTQKAQAAAEQLAPYTSFIALREARTQAVSQLVDSRFDWAHAFHELGRVLPRDASISSLDGAVGSTTATTPATAGAAASAAAKGAASGAVTSATPPGSVPTFTLSGCATSQAEVARTLNRLRLIQGVSEVTLESSTKSGASGGGGASAGKCAGSEPAFSVQVSFEPLPTPSAISSSAVRSAVSTGTGGTR